MRNVIPQSPTPPLKCQAGRVTDREQTVFKCLRLGRTLFSPFFSLVNPSHCGQRAVLCEDFTACSRAAHQCGAHYDNNHININNNNTPDNNNCSNKTIFLSGLHCVYCNYASADLCCTEFIFENNLNFKTLILNIKMHTSRVWLHRSLCIIYSIRCTFLYGMIRFKAVRFETCPARVWRELWEAAHFSKPNSFPCQRNESTHDPVRQACLKLLHPLSCREAATLLSTGCYWNSW